MNLEKMQELKELAKRIKATATFFDDAGRIQQTIGVAVFHFAVDNLNSIEKLQIYAVPVAQSPVWETAFTSEQCDAVLSGDLLVAASIIIDENCLAQVLLGLSHDPTSEYESVDYALTVQTETCKRCSLCKATDKVLQRCAGCKLVRFCNTACQTAHWTAGHKIVCKRLKILRTPTAE